jgi:hypothetical protein
MVNNKFSIEIGNMSMFQIMKFVRLLPIFYCFSYIIKCNLNLVNRSVYQVLEFHYTTEINNRWKPQYYYILYIRHVQLVIDFFSVKTASDLPPLPIVIPRFKQKYW